MLIADRHPASLTKIIHRERQRVGSTDRADEPQINVGTNNGGIHAVIPAPGDARLNVGHRFGAERLNIGNRAAILRGGNRWNGQGGQDSDAIGHGDFVEHISVSINRVMCAGVTGSGVTPSDSDQLASLDHASANGAARAA